MRNRSWLIPIAVLLSIMVPVLPAGAGELPPACDDEKVIEAAIEVMEDRFTEQGMAGDDVEKTTIGYLRKIDEDTKNADVISREERVVARKLRIDKTWVRFCYSPPYGRGIMRGRAKVAIAMHPYNPGEWGLWVENPITEVTGGAAGWGWLAQPYPEKP